METNKAARVDPPLGPVPYKCSVCHKTIYVISEEEEWAMAYQIMKEHKKGCLGG